MIWQLVKRDPAWRNALICAAASAVVCPLAPSEFLGMFAVIVAMCWVGSQPNVRATLFQAGLPIRARDLFLARLVALFAGVWLPVATGAAVLLLLGKAAEDLENLSVIAAGFSVLVLAAQSWRVREIDGSSLGSIVSLLLLFPAALLLRSATQPVFLDVCAVLCPLLFWNIWRQLPSAFEALPAKPEGDVSIRSHASAIAFVWSPILRSLFQWRTLAFMLLMVLPLASREWTLWTMFSLFAVLEVLPRMDWALTLPVRRASLLAGALLPCLAPLLLGLLLSNVFVPEYLTRVSLEPPPLEFWRTAPQGKAPLIQSPWHESWQAKIVPVAGLAVYNPYGWGPGNSRRFVEWQFLRATGAVYGQPVELRDAERLTSLRPLTRQTRFVMLKLAACASWAMLLVNVAFLAMHWRVRGTFARAPVAIVPLLFLQVACALWINLSFVSHPSVPNSASLVTAVLLRAYELLPAGLPAVALAAILPVALLSWTAARLFRGVELTSTPGIRT
jgi:hypothetical protein